ncbi:MAG: polysaccharide pyruvyl transferase family protein [Halopseudomonas sp.]|uniref:polysaccharide pyruvyl transferase family protein n=1 Tax=Halopseudomonas sp. TaxID=2901191 RepID=UPI0030025F1B
MLRAILFNDTSYDDHHGCQLVIRQIRVLAAEAGIHIAHASPVRHDWAKDGFLLERIAEADLCIVNGEGTMHDDAPAAMMLGRLARHCDELGIPCVLVNSVWQNNQQLIEFARDFSRIYVRDPLSKAELALSGVSSEVVPDLTLTFRPEIPLVPRHGLIVNGSVLKPIQQELWQALDRLPVEQNVRYLSIRTIPALRLGNERRFFFKSLKANSKMWRHRFSSRLRHPDASSSKGLGRLRWRYSVQSTAEFLNTISAAEGVVTGRFHMVTLCMITGTPFMALGSNTHKIEGLLEQAGLAGRLCDDYSQGLVRLASSPYSEQERERLQEFLADSLAAARRMFAGIAGLAKETQKR